MVHAFEVAGDVATQGEDAFATEGIDALDAFVGRSQSTVVHGARDELVFQPGGGKDFVDPNKQGAFLTVFFRADDVRKN